MYIFAGETANWTNLKWNFRDLCGRLPTGLEGRMPGGSGSYGAITVTVSSGKKEVGSVTWKLEELYVRVAWKCCCVNNVDLSYGFICFMPWLSLFFYFSISLCLCIMVIILRAPILSSCAFESQCRSSSILPYNIQYH